MVEICTPGSKKTPIYYEEEGEGNAILFLPGLTSSHRVFHVIFEPYLRGKGRLITLDLPGCGKSPELKTAHTFENYTQVVKAFLAALKISKVSLMGSSMGATLAISCALQLPETIQALVLHGPVYQGRDFPKGDLDRIRRYRNFALRYPLLGKYLLGLNLMWNFSGDLPCLLIRRGCHLLSLTGDFWLCSMKAVLDILEDMVNLDLEQDLGKIKVPLLLVDGDRVSYQPVNTFSRLERLFPQDKLEILLLPGGHLAPYVWPERFSEGVIHFLDNLPDFSKAARP